jgi:hypothetical protein
MTDTDIEALIRHAEADGREVGDMRPGSVASLAVLRLLRPGLMENDFVWSEVMGGIPEGKIPNQRFGLLEAYHFADFDSLAAFDAFYARLARFWEFY